MNVQFNDQQKQSLRKMAKTLGTSQAGVLKTALSLLKVTLNERKQHNQIAVIKDGKVVKKIIGILND